MPSKHKKGEYPNERTFISHRRIIINAIIIGVHHYRNDKHRRVNRIHSGGNGSYAIHFGGGYRERKMKHKIYSKAGTLIGHSVYDGDCYVVHLEDEQSIAAYYLGNADTKSEAVAMAREEWEIVMDGEL